MENKVVFISGASSGIGEACAYKFAENAYNVILTGRRKERLERLAETLVSKYSIKALPLCFDVRNLQEVNTAVSSLSGIWENVDILINNAGLAAGLSTIDEGDINDWEIMIDTNLKGLLYLSRAISRIMISRKKGHIINIGSIAGKEVYLKGNVYCATKHAVDALTKGMRIDLLSHNIKVTAVHPGAVETEFSLVRFKGDAGKAKDVYKGFEPLHGEDIADLIYYAASRPAHINLNDIVIMPTAQANTSHLIRK